MPHALLVAHARVPGLVGLHEADDTGARDTVCEGAVAVVGRVGNEVRAMLAAVGVAFHGEWIGRDFHRRVDLRDIELVAEVPKRVFGPRSETMVGNHRGRQRCGADLDVEDPRKGLYLVDGIEAEIVPSTKIAAIEPEINLLAV